jgi:hypothetical protein
MFQKEEHQANFNSAGLTRKTTYGARKRKEVAPKERREGVGTPHKPIESWAVVAIVLHC